MCKKCKIGLNKELVKTEGKKCPQCGNKNLVEKKTIEVGNIFKLGTKFSKAFNFKYLDKNGKEKDIIMGCYGIGPSRIMGTLVEVYHDREGIIWPKEVSPFDAHLLNLAKESKKADKLYDILQTRGIDVLYDKRDVSPGIKFKDADLIGIPIRLVVSDKTGEMVEIKYRKSKKVKLVHRKSIFKFIHNNARVKYQNAE